MDAFLHIAAEGQTLLDETNHLMAMLTDPAATARTQQEARDALTEVIGKLKTNIANFYAQVEEHL